MSTETVLAEIADERARQIAKWGGQENDDKWSALDWHEMLADYNAWARRMAAMGSHNKARRRYIQLAALAVAAVEAIDRRTCKCSMPASSEESDYYVHCNAALAVAEGQSRLNIGLGWISVKDKLPEYEVNVFVAMPGGISIGAISNDGDGWLWSVADYIGGDLASAECMCDDDYSSITHWMPIMDMPNAMPPGADGMTDMSVIEQVMSEVQRATTKFPIWPTDPLHALAVLGEEYGELNKAMLQLTYEPHKTSVDEVRKEAVQTAAMALRLVMSLDRYEYARCPQHEQYARSIGEKIL